MRQSRQPYYILEKAMENEKDMLWPECSDVSHLILVDGEDEADWNNQYTQYDNDNSKHS